MQQPSPGHRTHTPGNHPPHHPHHTSVHVPPHLTLKYAPTNPSAVAAQGSCGHTIWNSAMLVAEIQKKPEGVIRLNIPDSLVVTEIPKRWWWPWTRTLAQMCAACTHRGTLRQAIICAWCGRIILPEQSVHYGKLKQNKDDPLEPFRTRIGRDTGAAVGCTRATCPSTELMGTIPGVWKGIQIQHHK